MNAGMLTIYRNRLLQKTFDRILERMPYRTGDMLNKYTHMEITPTGFIITIDAPYSVYVNEEWISPQWNGAENPNQGFIQQIVQDIIDIIKREELIDANDSIGKYLPVGDVVKEYQKEKYGFNIDELNE